MSGDLTGARCAEVGDPELWHPPRGNSAAAARAVCADCPVRAACLEVAMTTPVSGIWGGTSETERRGLARLQGRAYDNRTGNTDAARGARQPESQRRQQLREGATRRTVSHRPGSKDARATEARRLAAAGVSREAIAAVLGVGERVVASYLAPEAAA